MYKIGDKVEYLNNVWEVCDWEVDSVEIYNEKMGVNIYVPIDDVKPYRTAHDKLIEIGYRISQTTALTHSLYTIYEKDGSSITIIERRSGNAYKTRQEVSLELSCILTQYLEELE